MTNYRTHLSADKIRKALDYDPTSGIFRWRHRADRELNWNRRWAGKPAGSMARGYVVITIDKPGAYQASRLAWLYMTGAWPILQIDHINGDRSDNRFCNLRAVDNAENGANRGPQRNNRMSGLRGVRFHRPTGKWHARIMIRGQDYSLGLHETPEQAGIARDAFVQAHLGEFGRRSDSVMTTYAPNHRPTSGS